jgi:[ribosomal protein S5]-alanine N-acetyltransferase
MDVSKICNNLPVIETDRLTLRIVTIDDLDNMYEYGSNANVSKYVTWNTHSSISDTKAFLQTVLEQYESEQAVFWGIEHKESAKLIGTIDFVSWNTKHRVGELGYVLSEKYWGQGIMTEAAKEVIKFGFNQMYLVRIQARCLTENIGSERVMKKTGMTLEGIHRKSVFIKGKHRDIKMYSILEEEFIS